LYLQINKYYLFISNSGKPSCGYQTMAEDDVNSDVNSGFQQFMIAVLCSNKS